MELSLKDKILIVIYQEYQKDIPNYRDVLDWNLFGAEKEVFGIAVEKLLNENLIDGVGVVRCGTEGKFAYFAPSNVMMTSSGLEYVENKLEIKPELSNKEKNIEIGKKLLKFGWEEVKDIGTTLAVKLITSL